MLWRDVIDLISETHSENAMGDVITANTLKQVFANKKSIRQSEFYQAHSSGLKPEIMFEIRAIDYSGEKSIQYDGKRYSIIRQFSKNGEIVELICEGVVNNGSA